MSNDNLRSSLLSVRGLNSPIIEAGPADADEALVFVHGNPGSSRDWAGLVAGAGEFGRALAFDMPGFGRADKPDGFDYTVAGYADHLAAALEQLGLRRVHLVLHDFGGPWGLAWAAAHPQQLASVTLVNTGVFPGYSWHYLAQIWRTPLLGELFQALATRGAFHLLLKHGNPRGLPRAFVDRMYDDYDAGTRRAVLRLYRATGDIDGLSQRVIAALAPLRIPALVVWGAHDPYIPLRYAERQREAFPDARVEVLADSGHWPMADNPQGLQAHLLPFLRAQIAGGKTL
ncbi:alpha/beta fold hydrolase [Hydrocarboniphaga sp.]|uniref:alpha/beta fold hydrolase n=1 Tax=Hydrocarboniphaga sp. TaxID=2033016 RepID=UPI003D0CFCF1